MYQSLLIYAHRASRLQTARVLRVRPGHACVAGCKLGRGNALSCAERTEYARTFWTSPQAPKTKNSIDTASSTAPSRQFLTSACCPLDQMPTSAHMRVGNAPRDSSLALPAGCQPWRAFQHLRDSTAPTVQYATILMKCPSWTARVRLERTTNQRRFKAGERRLPRWHKRSKSLEALVRDQSGFSKHVFRVAASCCGCAT
jgi:hypothetical protein